jgi:hypothetical protein
MVTYIVCVLYISVALGAFAYMYDQSPGLAWYGHLAYTFFALTWPFWLPALTMHAFMRAIMPVILFLLLTPVFAQGGGGGGTPMSSIVTSVGKVCVFEIKNGQVKTTDCDLGKYLRNPIIKMIGNNETIITFEQIEPYTIVGSGGGGQVK